jgi:hypothetical protein
VLGFSMPNTPLSSIHPAGVVGCDLLASPDSIRLLLPVAGLARMALAIPNIASLAGLVLHQQVLELEGTSVTHVSRLAGTNALTITIGVF